MNWAAWPDEAATAATPPSSAAMRFSKTSTVGYNRAAEVKYLVFPIRQNCFDVGIPGTYVHDTAVDVAELLEAKEPGAMGGVIEGVGLVAGSLEPSLTASPIRCTVVARGQASPTNSSGIDGHSTRVCCGIRFLTAAT